MQAQVVRDPSLQGIEQSVVTSQQALDIVTGGAMRGSRLFHSFLEFNVDGGRSLYFSPADTITQIFSRVTGSNPSNIDGTLGVLGNADLFVLNPNGILFGPNAQLDLAGSFHASAASGLQFEGFEFSAIQPQAVPLLNVSAPLGINFGRAPGAIVNRSTANGTGLTVKPFQTLALSGGEIALEGGGAITVADGRIELTSAGDIALTDGAQIAVNGVVGNPESEIRLVGQGITLDGQSQVRSQNNSTAVGASISLEGQTLAVMDGSQLAAATQGSGRGGNITAELSERITVTSADRRGQIGMSSRIITETMGSGRSGDINIRTGQLLFEYDSPIINLSNAFTTGDVGNITIDASDSITGKFLSPLTGIGAYIGIVTLGFGDGGVVSVTTPRLILRDHHVVANSTWLFGNAGDIRVDADQILLDGVSSEFPAFSSAITAIVYGSGKGGNIQVNTENLVIQNGGSVITTVVANRDEVIQGVSRNVPQVLPLRGLSGSGSGDAGYIDISADKIFVDGFPSVSPSRPSQLSSISLGSGNAGEVDIKTKELTIRQGGVVGTSSLFSFSALGLPVGNSGLGNGGNLIVDADNITVTGVNSGTDLPSLLGTQTASLGDAGNTQITTRRLNVGNGGAVISGTFTSGDSGQLQISAEELITVDGINANGQPSTIGTFAAAPSMAFQQAFFLPVTPPDGDTGQLIVNSDRLTLSNGGTLSVAHQGTGDAGTLAVNVNQLLLSQEGRLAATSNLGEGGNVMVNVKDLLALRQGSSITATALGEQGNGGNLAIAAGAILAVPDEDSDIIANAKGGNGGSITLRTSQLFGLKFQEQLTSQSDITASSEIGLNGTVNIDLFAVDPNQGLVELPTALINPDEQISTDCRRTVGSRFIASGRSGLPLDPRQQSPGLRSLEDWREFNDVSLRSTTQLENQREMKISMPTHRPRSAPQSIEAEGWYIDMNNHVKLVAQATELGSINSELQPLCPYSSFR